MYYPLLRARQFELISLRELCNEGALGDRIIPILEPVKDSFNNLDLAFQVFSANNQTINLILNPQVGDIRGDGDVIINHVEASYPNRNWIKPAFYFTYDNSNYITEIINEHGLEDCMIICPNDISEVHEDFWNLIEIEQISVVTALHPLRNREFKRAIDRKNKNLVRLDDLFEAEPRNSNFLARPARMFSEEHNYYAADGYYGFADFTALPSEFIDGGSTPRAVVIHLTYVGPNDQIWIRHFTSDRTDGIADVQGKFAEAALKAVNYCRAEGITNSAITELIDYLETEHYPGLGVVKKISIKNHILQVRSLL